MKSERLGLGCLGLGLEGLGSIPAVYRKVVRTIEKRLEVKISCTLFSQDSVISTLLLLHQGLNIKNLSQYLNCSFFGV